ncbi:uncharacterized protein LAESUDRAFT_713319 [Laetiporus sulphureus 93-53]|uniref:Uncharacterized protein n=1 Tax=Laetiporus sulphureus 93-53 TaxID=1314785 RepID=A0A165ER23_9APHY|nr:uncharacterized protein LAESUDRAFT_713319 [Laetiporus sulphureus 93-53]KZT07587.1 hypothetical protein LAESUDRAFT_713319 [Laetiporus sulphureus 93-53]
MPTVPSSCVPLASLADEGVRLVPAGLHLQEDTAGPTPDPDLDDLVLVPAESGNVVTSTHAPELPAAYGRKADAGLSVKPRLSLGNLALHSPSSIIGTPFDLSPRFEYPFPTPPCEPEIPLSMSASLPNIRCSAAAFSMPFIGGAIGSGAPSFSTLPRPRAGVRGFSPTRLKLRPREPPMPPTLAKKRRITRENRQRRESAPDAISESSVTPTRSPGFGRRTSDDTVVSDESLEGMEGGSNESKDGVSVVSKGADEELLIRPASSSRTTSEVTLSVQEGPKTPLDALEDPCSAPSESLAVASATANGSADETHAVPAIGAPAPESPRTSSLPEKDSA